ncbi:MAG TPA: hypothetical protein P5290_05680 [Candidatus Methanomethylicus sp.]|nr:hypothetical protein [Candidatus Methanomethylicus sp.]
MKFAYYGFELSIPKEWVANFDKKSNYGAGMVSFVTPGKLRLEHIWDSLEKQAKKHATLADFMKSYFDSLRANKSYKDLNIVDAPSVDGDHETNLHEFSCTVKRPIKTTSTQILGLAMYCRATNRFVIVFSSLDPKKENPESPQIREAMKGFRCVHE